MERDGEGERRERKKIERSGMRNGWTKEKGEKTGKKRKKQNSKNKVRTKRKQRTRKRAPERKNRVKDEKKR